MARCDRQSSQRPPPSQSARRAPHPPASSSADGRRACRASSSSWASPRRERRRSRSARSLGHRLDGLGGLACTAPSRRRPVGRRALPSSCGRGRRGTRAASSSSASPRAGRRRAARRLRRRLDVPRGTGSSSATTAAPAPPCGSRLGLAGSSLRLAGLRSAAALPSASIAKRSSRKDFFVLKANRLPVSFSSSSRCSPFGAGQDRGDVGVKLDQEGFGLRAGDMGAELPLDLDRARLGRDDDAGRLAGRALLREDLARAVGDVLAGHLDEAERRDLDDVRLRPVACELGVERVLDELAVLRVRHVDEVDDDDPADVAKPELAHDLADGLEVVLRDRVLEPRVRRLAAAADESAGVDVDDGEGLGVVEDEVAARRQVDPARERRAHGLEHARLLEQRHLALVALDARGELGRGALEVARRSCGTSARGRRRRA